MIDRGKRNVVGVLVDAVDRDAAVHRVMSAVRERRPLTVSAIAVHGVTTGSVDRTFRHRLNRFDLVVPDGQPIRWALNVLHGTGLPERVCGRDLMLSVCRRAADESLPIFLYGSTEEVQKRVIAGLERRVPGIEIAGSLPSMFRRTTDEEKGAIVRAIRDSGARLVFVGLGCPRQEVWAYEYRDLLPMPLMAVGAAFDFIAGTLPEAPRRLQRLGLEWFYRLVKEPRRLWRRYVLGNPLFIGLAVSQYLGWRLDPAAGADPSEEFFG